MNELRRFVSVMIPNFNHGRFIEECVESVLAQTYPLVEVVVLDNHSTDDSRARLRRFEKRGVRVCRNPINILNMSYRLLAEQLTSGEYMMLLGADDAIEPEFVERAVKLFESFPNVGYVHTERKFVTSDGSSHALDPFYPCSFIAPGRSDTRVYMVTTVAHAAQGVFRRSAFNRIGGYDHPIDHLNVDRSLWFLLSQVSDYGYICEPLARVRIGDHSDTTRTERNFQHPLLCHLMIRWFARQARAAGLSDVAAREQEGLHKLAEEALSVVARLIASTEFDLAERYLAYATVLSEAIRDQPLYRELEALCRARSASLSPRERLEDALFSKRRCYPPPHGFQPIEFVPGESWRLSSQ